MDTKKYIKVKGQDVLCPIILYIDKTTLDTPGWLTLEPVYFTLGIWKWYVRNRPEAWRPLGYLTTSNKRPREGARSMVKIPIMFTVGDTEGHDRLCGHFLCQTGGVKQLCRTCECPTAECNSSKVNYRKWKAAKLEEMAANRDLEELKAMPQHPIINAFHSLDFMSAGGRGSMVPAPERSFI